MARYVVHVSALLALAEREAVLAAEHTLFAPPLVRSQVLSQLHEAVHAGTLDAEAAQRRLAWINRQRLRLLGDLVLRRLAWELADRLKWPSTYDAEYIALTQLQADAFITMNLSLASSVAGIVPVATIDMLSLDD